MSFRRDIKISYLQDNSEERVATKRVDMASQCLLYFVVLFCFLTGTSGIIRYLFFQVKGEYVQVNIFAITLLFIPMIVSMKYASEMEKRKNTFLLRGAIALFYVVAFCLYFFSNLEKFYRGFAHIKWLFCVAINQYYKLNLTVDMGFEADCGFALGISLFVIFAVTLYFALMIETRNLLVVLPILACALSMSVGYSSDTKSAVYIAVGILLACSTSWERYQTSLGKNKRERKLTNLVITLFIAIILPLVNTFMFEDRAEEIVDTVAPQVKEFQKKIDEKIRDRYEKKIQDLTDKYEGQERESITNRKPIYEEKPVFSITIDKKPENNLYFREFYGMEYMSGAWLSQFSTFDRLEGVKGRIRNWLVASMGESTEAYLLSRARHVYGTMHYAEKTKLVHIPHTYNIDNHSVNYKGEYVANRNNPDEDIRFSGYDISLQGVLDYPDLSSVVGDVEKYREYSAYVSGNYTSGSDRVPTAQEIADRMKPYLNMYLLDGVYSEYATNTYRVYSALLVSEYLSTANYSLDLKGSARGIDNVEYFLSDSHEGFCIHFASAGTLILQAMGVPARYASGYVATPSDFSGIGTRYTAEVLDSDAHAWTEIYLENIGWVPVEMTAGYENGRSMYIAPGFNTIEDDPLVNDIEDLTTEDTETDKTEEVVNTTEVSTENTVATTEEEQRVTGNVENTTSVTSESTVLPAEENQDIKIPNERRMYIIIILLLLFMTMVAFFLVRGSRYSKRHIEKILRTDVKKALFLVNDVLVRKLRRKNHVIKKNTSDLEYITYLEDYVPIEERNLIARYVEIIQRARFSNHEVTTDDVEFCMALCYNSAPNNKFLANRE